MADDDEIFDQQDPEEFVSAPSFIAPPVDQQVPSGEAPLYDETRQRSVSHANKVPLPPPGLSGDPALAPGTWSTSGSTPPGVAPNPNRWHGAVGTSGSAPPGVAPNPNQWNGAVGTSGSAPPGVAPNPNQWNGAVGLPGAAQTPNPWNGAVGTSGPVVPTNPWSGYSGFGALARPDQMDVASPYIPRRSYPADPHHRLRKAVYHNDRQTVLEALRSGGGVGRDKSGKTALHIAANRGNYELLYILLGHGLDPNVAKYDGHTVVDEAEYWAMNGSEAERHMRRRCRDLLAAYGGRRNDHSETVRQGRLKLENKNFGIPPPWRDDLEAVGRDSQWMKQCPTMDGWTPPIADGSDVPDPENSDDLGRPTPWDPAPERPAPPPAAAPSPTPAPAARAAVPTLPAMSTADFTADSTWGDSAEPKLLREMLRKPYATYEEFTNRTNIVRNLILDLQKHPRNLYIKMPAVPPFDPNGRSYEV